MPQRPRSDGIENIARSYMTGEFLLSAKEEETDMSRDSCCKKKIKARERRVTAWRQRSVVIPKPVKANTMAINLYVYCVNFFFIIILNITWCHLSCSLVLSCLPPPGWLFGRPAKEGQTLEPKKCVIIMCTINVQGGIFTTPTWMKEPVVWHICPTIVSINTTKEVSAIIHPSADAQSG